MNKFNLSIHSGAFYFREGSDGMFWLGGLTGYFLGTLVTLLVIYFGYRIGEE
ncbi:MULTISPECIES: hypothetical protein [Bacillus]|uniref:hypothetical protein n=1 Tax=Bacillus TaxID=1386 RepID=UPI001482E0F5|nr:hypothetical protein [Bacillus pseudomycoides]